MFSSLNNILLPIDFLVLSLFYENQQCDTQNDVIGYCQ